jgi:hypothetical protein
MSTYQMDLLLEALAKVYSSQELSDVEPVVSSLVDHLGLSNELAEAFVTGALHLKEARARLGDLQARDTFIQ